MSLTFFCAISSEQHIRKLRKITSLRCIFSIIRFENTYYTNTLTPLPLEHKAKIDEKVGLLVQVAIAQRSAQRSEHRVVEIAHRASEHGAVIK